MAREPVLASSIASGTRLLLKELRHWDDVRRLVLLRERGAQSWIDGPISGSWALLERHAAIMSALLECRGEAVTREVGRARLREALRSGHLASIFRSWARSYASLTFVRVVPHAWTAATRHCGRMQFVSSSERSVGFVLLGAPASVREAVAWHRFLEGYGEGILDVAGLSGTVRVATRSDGEGAIDVVFTS